MKIKTTKTMNLPQLIEHIVETSYECNKYIADNAKSSVYVGSIKGVVVEGTIFPTDTFTVEVEEEITEDTEIQEMLLVFNNGVTHLVENRSLNCLDTSCLKSAYTMNDDLRLILIWRDGKLVE